MADYIPFISQTKSLVQAIIGDTEGARKTQNNFTKSFPVISQVRGGIELALGDTEAAKDTFKAGGTFIDGIPVVGHMKGAIHYACGDNEGGAAAMMGASRTTAVIAGSAGGFVVGGPFGAAAGGMAGGAVMDGLTSAADSLIHGEKRLHGTFRAAEKVVENPKDGWGYVDAVLIPAADAMGGYKAGISFAEGALTSSGLQRAHMVKQIARNPQKVGKIIKKVHGTKHAEEAVENLHSEDEEDEANVGAVVPISDAVDTDAYRSCNRRP